MVKWFIALSISSFLIANNEAILHAISTFNVRQLELELRRHGALKRNIKKEIIKVVDSLIAQESENNVWYKKYDALAQIGISIPLLILSGNYLSNLPKIHENSFSGNLMAFFAGKALVAKYTSEEEDKTPEEKSDTPSESTDTTSTEKTTEQDKKLTTPNTVLTAASGLLGGIGFLCLLQGLIKLGYYTPRYICALAMKTLVLAVPDAKSIELTDDRDFNRPLLQRAA